MKLFQLSLPFAKKSIEKHLITLRCKQDSTSPHRSDAVLVQQQTQGQFSGISKSQPPGSTGRRRVSQSSQTQVKWWEENYPSDKDMNKQTFLYILY